MREPGFYWICVNPEDGLTIGEYSVRGYWTILGDDRNLSDDQLCHIDEKRIRPPYVVIPKDFSAR